MWQLDVVLGLALADLLEDGEALLWAIVFFHIPINGGVDIVRVVSPTILCAVFVSWCTLVMNQVTKEP